MASRLAVAAERFFATFNTGVDAMRLIATPPLLAALDHNSVWAVEAEETVTVPAGTYRTLKIVSRNRSTGALTYEMWYAGDARQWSRFVRCSSTPGGFCCAPIRSPSEAAVTCPACGQEERQDRKRARSHRPPGGRLTLTLHHECPTGHAWHGPLVIRPGVPPAPCDCEAEG